MRPCAGGFRRHGMKLSIGKVLVAIAVLIGAAVLLIPLLLVYYFVRAKGLL